MLAMIQNKYLVSFNPSNGFLCTSFLDRDGIYALSWSSQAAGPSMDLQFRVWTLNSLTPMVVGGVSNESALSFPGSRESGFMYPK